MKLIPTILCGGAGSRLWPVSRDLHPKPFIKLSDGESLLQKTYKRATTLDNVNEILTVTNSELYFKTASEFQDVCPPELLGSFILEPIGRNTAPAIATAALYIAQKHGEDTIMLALPADHLITDLAAFRIAVDEAIILAEQGKITTFGIQPDKPETGYGYIEIHNRQVLRFIEKPSQDKAEQYLHAGNFYWNSGMFCFSAGTILEELEKHSPEIFTSVANCIEHSSTSEKNLFECLDLNKDTFKSVPNISIDFAVMEKTTHLAAIPCNIGWHDIGSWNALGQLTPSDNDNNTISGKAILEDVQNCHIQSEERVIGAVGVKDLLIIDTSDALLVADKSCAQDVKKIYQKLKNENHEASRLHRTVHRPWGTYTVLEEGPQFKIKRIVVNPGASLSLQMHHHRSEHWIVVSGTAKIQNGDHEQLIRTNESTYIPAGNIHRLENPGILELVMIEVQSGQYLGEDDIVRFEDNYGRC